MTPPDERQAMSRQLGAEGHTSGETEAERTRRPPSARRWSGVVVGIGVLALVAVPAVVTAFFALASFRWSEPPEPAVGALWAGITVILLSLPIAAGLVTARAKRVQSPRGWLIIALAATVLIAFWRLIQRVV